MKLALITLLLTVLISPARALIMHGAHSLSPVESAVAGMVGKIGKGSGIYLGQGLVLTASHVSPGDLELGGVTLPYIPHSSLLMEDAAGTPLDLLLYRVETTNAPDVQIRINADPMSAGASVLLVGCGLGQTDEPLRGFDGSVFGFEWSDKAQHQAGRARIDQANAERVTLGFTDTPIFTTSFAQNSPSAQATTGDSGGAAFMMDPTTGKIELVGVIVGAVGREGHSRFGSSTRIADLSEVPYLQLLDGLGDSKLALVPEPSSAFLFTMALGAGLLQRRRRAPVRFR